MRITKIMKRIKSSIIVFCWSLCNLVGQNLPKIFSEDPTLSHAQIGILIINTNTNDTIEEYCSKTNMTPASLQKLFTTATVLETYGTDYKIPTFLEYEGQIKNGVLEGNLFIRGTGDPTLGSRAIYGNNPTNFLYTWIQKVKDAGIQQINGSVIADASFFDEEAINPGWLWEDIGNYYAPGVMALAYMDNTINIVLQSGAVGSNATILKTYPEYPDIEFINYIKCTQINYDGAFVHGLPYDNKRFLFGSIPSKLGSFGIMGDMPNPPLFLAKHFTDALISSGIAVKDSAKYIISNNPKTPRNPIYTHLSKSLDTIVQEINFSSNNLYAEVLFRRLGENYGTPCSIYNSIAFMYDYWTTRIRPMQYCVIKDGCGLASKNSVSPETFVQLLRYMEKSKNAEVFYNSLPTSGEKGTLAGIFTTKELKGKVHAKSGSFENVRNYAGYIDAPNGDKWVFAIMISGAKVKQKHLRIKIERYLQDVYQRNA